MSCVQIAERTNNTFPGTLSADTYVGQMKQKHPRIQSRQQREF